MQREAHSSLVNSQVPFRPRRLPQSLRRSVSAVGAVTTGKMLRPFSRAANLWPESFRTQPWNARVKDQLENFLHAEVCAGRMPIEQAQREIAEDWIAAYQKYLGEPTLAPHTPRANPAPSACPPRGSRSRASRSVGTAQARSLQSMPRSSSSSGRSTSHSPSPMPIHASICHHLEVSFRPAP